MTEQPARPPLSEIVGVRYDGLSDRRVITSDELAAVGVTVEHDFTWTRGGVAPVNRLNAATVDHLLTDPDFSLVLRDADPVGGDGDA